MILALLFLGGRLYTEQSKATKQRNLKADERVAVFFLQLWENPVYPFVDVRAKNSFNIFFSFPSNT